MRNLSKLVFMVLFASILTANWVMQMSSFTYAQKAAKPLQGWMYRWGDSALNDHGIPVWTQEPETDGGGWSPIDTPFNPEHRDNQETLWLKAAVPEYDWRDPSLLLQMYEHYEIYTEQGMFYNYGFDANSYRHEAQYPAASLRLISLPADAPGHTIYFRVHSGSHEIGLAGDALVGAKADFLMNLFRRDLDDLLLGFLYAILGIAFFYTYYLFRSQKIFFSFAVFALFFGVFCLSRTATAHLFYDHSLLWAAIEAGSLILGIVGLIQFIEQMFGAGPGRYIRRLWQCHLGFAFVAMALLLLGIACYSELQAVYYYFIFGTMALILPKLFAHVSRDVNDANIFLLGSLALCTAAAIDIVDGLAKVKPTLHYVTTLGLAVMIAAIFMQLLRRLMELMMIARNSEKLSMVSQLAAGVAHEIRNPMSVISGFVQLLKKDPGQSKYLDLISSEIDRMNGIVGDFLLFSKPSKETLTRRHVADILRETLELFKAEMMNKRITLDFRVEEDLPQVNCDANQLKQVFMNIIKNGIESMGDDGMLYASVESEGRKQIRVRITDQGVGIPPEELKNIGQPFYTTKEQGTGLGLMISVKYLEYHGGTMQIRSKVNEGTTVDILLPVNTQLFMEKGMAYPL